MKNIKIILPMMIAFMLFQGCAIVRPGEVGVDVHFGKVKPGVMKPGPHHFMGFIGRKIERFDTRIINYSRELNFHTQEGIEVTSEITILYHIIPDSVIRIYQDFGAGYQETVIEDNLITILRQTGLDFGATQLITERNTIENTVKEKMNAVIGKYGFAMDLVMLKEVDLPQAVVETIEAQLNAEEIAKRTKIENETKRNLLDFELEKQRKEKETAIVTERMQIDFNIEKQKKESERLLIEAEAIKKQQAIINSTLNDLLIKYKSLEITRDLVNSKNSKIIVTDGKSPVIVNEKGN
ncbi:MAG: SPFH domain-containing protein [Cyclobacteriaceae bacterium]|jgi:prohibitin 1|uniref:SPFH domain-containing protein n=1 Tax=Roseihalotalea indica TaxID=2867963 RepID=A0AA49GPG0_9BACT|nr:SPFH domain-containing protein [Tunicatimonas sp. TK19036]|tara:strand:- start:956 stop:1840 length:885 start_codon:yes stop_codon:yes gene_type:complete